MPCILIEASTKKGFVALRKKYLDQGYVPIERMTKSVIKAWGWQRYFQTLDLTNPKAS